MWQTSLAGRHIIPVHHFEIDFIAREVVMFYDTKRYQVDSSLPLYLKLDYRASVFKISTFRSRSECLHFSFPAEIKTRELRHALRHQLSGEKEKYVILKPMTKTDSGAEVKVRAQDISQYGLGLVISEQNRSFIKNNRILWVAKLQDTLINPILAEVVYINNEVELKTPGKKLKELKIGLKLSEMIPQNLLDDFLR